LKPYLYTKLYGREFCHLVEVMNPHVPSLGGERVEGLWEV
jgi:hypothetical protein